VKTVLLSGIPLYDEHHILYAYVVVMRDLQVDEKLEHTRRREMFESLTTLAAGLAHEIGNPLNTIHIYLQLIGKELKKNGSTKKVDEFIHVISSETRRLDKLVKNFLNVTRSKVSLIRKRSINEPIRNALNFFKPELIKNSIECQIDLDKDIPEFYLDTERLYEAFTNLIKNAIEAMPRGGLLKVKSTLNNNIVTVIFSDTGIGIDPNDLPHIFDAYYTNKDGGSGLGLMNVYTIIKAHKGRIHVESEPQNGTIISVSLPIRREKLQLPLFTHN
jgi:two-component system, sporulation sensor kinase E